MRKRAIALLAKGMKQTFIAEVLGVGQSTVSQWLTAY
ncbi:MAG: helix-turn-helix domain-containing protein, partial [Aureispira sp.]|nr:helix-turn-helix domain-containing protein [Aureispira sp.]